MKFRKLVEEIIDEPKESIGLRAFYTSGVWMSDYFYYENYATKDECLEAALRCCDMSCNFQIQYILPGVNDRGCKDGAWKGSKYQLLYVTFRHGKPQIESKDSRIKYDPVNNKMYLDSKGKLNTNSRPYYQEIIMSIADVLSNRGFEAQGWYQCNYYMRKNIESTKHAVQARIERNRKIYSCTLTASSLSTGDHLSAISLNYNPDSERSIKKFQHDLDEFLNNLPHQTAKEYAPIDTSGDSNDYLIIERYIPLKQLIRRFKIFTDNYTVESGKVLMVDIPFLEEDEFCQHIESFYKIKKTNDYYHGQYHQVIEFYK